LSWGYTLGDRGARGVRGLARARPGSDDAHSRARSAGVWFGLLALGSLRSPFAPPEALIPLVWALALRPRRPARAARRRSRALLWISMMIVIPVPVAPAAIAGLALQAVIYATAIGLVLAARRGTTSAGPKQPVPKVSSLAAIPPRRGVGTRDATQHRRRHEVPYDEEVVGRRRHRGDDVFRVIHRERRRRGPAGHHPRGPAVRRERRADPRAPPP
jgi:hypothetical protein